MTDEEEDYEPGLGCPHCNWAGYTFPERAAHIKSAHPDEQFGPTDEMKELADRAGVSPSHLEIFHDRRDNASD